MYLNVNSKIASVFSPRLVILMCFVVGCYLSAILFALIRKIVSVPGIRVFTVSMKVGFREISWEGLVIDAVSQRHTYSRLSQR